MIKKLDKARLYLPSWFEIVYVIGEIEQPYVHKINKLLPYSVSHISHTVRNLEKQSYLVKKPFPKYRSKNILVLTKKGERTYQAIEIIKNYSGDTV